MKNKLLILALLLLSSCASFQVSTLNHDHIYVVEGSNTEINVISNRFELNRFLRNDFNFRYNFAQYALSQPPSFDGSRRENNTNTNRRRTNTQPVTITTTSRRIVINKKPRKVIRNTSNSTLRTNTRRRIPLARTPIRVNTPTRTIRVVSNNTQPTRKVNSRRKN